MSVKPSAYPINHIDLHAHSRASDGSLTPHELIDRAIQKGAQALALTDHDCLQGLPEAQQAALEAGLPFVPGVEISVTWLDKHTIHIVGLSIDPTDANLTTELAKVRQGRLARLADMSDQLAAIGIPGVYQGALALASNPETVGRAHITRYLVQEGFCKRTSAVFRHYLVPGKPGYVPHRWATLEDAIQWIRDAGGVAILAHPGRYDLGKTLIERLITAFKAAGGVALEVASASHSLDDRLKFARYANEYDLLASAGSDFHVPDEPGREVGNTPALPEQCIPVWTVLPELKNLIQSN